MVTLYAIRKALLSIKSSDGDLSTEYIDAAIESLKTASEALNTIAVRGRKDIDTLFGCMIGLDMIIGKEDDCG